MNNKAASIVDQNQACAKGISSGSNGPRADGPVFSSYCRTWLSACVRMVKSLAIAAVLAPCSSLLRGGLKLISPQSVWGPPLLKVVLGGILLMGVAYLGHLSSRLDRDGPVRVLDERVLHLAALARGQEPSPRSPASSPASSLASLSGDKSGVVGPQPGVTLAQTKVEAKPPLIPPGCPETKSTGPTGITDDGRVILNEATVDEFTSLPGIGKSRATAIVELRARLKGFKKVADLLRIKGIGWKSLNKLKDKVVLNRPEQDESGSQPESGPDAQTPKAESDDRQLGPPSDPTRAPPLVASMAVDPLR